MFDFKKHIREVPNWPVDGVNFKDITTLLADKLVFKEMVESMAEPYIGKKIDKIVAIDARGFLLATPMAYILGCGVVLVRKKGKLPYKTIEETYEKEYGPDVLTMNEDAISKGEKVILVDDILATGGTMLASIKLVRKLKGEVVGISVLVDLPFLGGSTKLNKYQLNYLVNYEKE